MVNIIMIELVLAKSNEIKLASRLKKINYREIHESITKT